jgi:toxin ParE1/3/4
MPRVALQPRARADLFDIWEYISRDSEAKADEFIQSLDATFHLLASQPGIGRVRNELLPGLLSFPVGRYVVFYKQTSNGIVIVRVLHAARSLHQKFPKR